MALQRSPLHDRHQALGAKFAEFGGWEMPLEYPTGVVKEHTGVRERVGVFDVSHLGTVVVRGPGAAAHVDACLSNALSKIEPGKAQYTLCLDDATGGIVDDLIVYLHDDDHLLLIPNAANSAEVVARLQAQAPAGVEVVDHHADYAILAVQGPASDEVLRAVGLPVGHGYMSFVEHPYADDAPVTVCRTGYTGERGYELVVPADAAVRLWDDLLAAGEAHDMVPAGLGARDTLRTEMGYPLHGQDISLETTPVQARLGWAVGWRKPAFWGREVVTAEREAGAQRLLRGLVAQGRGIPRPHMQVLAGDVPVGEITSGTFSPTLRKGVAMALLEAEVQEGDDVVVDVRGRAEVFTVTRPPFVEPGVKEA